MAKLLAVVLYALAASDLAVQVRHQAERTHLLPRPPRERSFPCARGGLSAAWSCQCSHHGTDCHTISSGAPPQASARLVMTDRAADVQVRAPAASQPAVVPPSAHIVQVVRPLWGFITPKLCRNWGTATPRAALDAALSPGRSLATRRRRVDTLRDACRATASRARQVRVL
jgi:hypothetical protein